jgi:hypothetical protein
VVVDEQPTAAGITPVTVPEPTSLPAARVVAATSDRTTKNAVLPFNQPEATARSSGEACNRLQIVAHQIVYKVTNNDDNRSELTCRDDNSINNDSDDDDDADSLSDLELRVVQDDYELADLFTPAPRAARMLAADPSRARTAAGKLQMLAQVSEFRA